MPHFLNAGNPRIFLFLVPPAKIAGSSWLGKVDLFKYIGYMLYGQYTYPEAYDLTISHVECTHEMKHNTRKMVLRTKRPIK